MRGGHLRSGLASPILRALIGAVREWLRATGERVRIFGGRKGGGSERESVFYTVALSPPPLDISLHGRVVQAMWQEVQAARRSGKTGEFVGVLIGTRGRSRRNICVVEAVASMSAGADGPAGPLARVAALVSTVERGEYSGSVVGYCRACTVEQPIRDDQLLLESAFSIPAVAVLVDAVAGRAGVLRVLGCAEANRRPAIATFEMPVAEPSAGEGDRGDNTARPHPPAPPAGGGLPAAPTQEIGKATPAFTRTAAAPNPALALILVAAAVIAGLTVRLHGDSWHVSAPQQPAVQTSGLGLKVHPGGGGLRLTWNSQSEALSRAQGAILTISERKGRREIVLGREELRSGTVFYSSAEPDVTFQLDVFGAAGPLTESVRNISDPGARGF